MARVMASEVEHFKFGLNLGGLWPGSEELADPMTKLPDPSLA
jgi:hypothetical protein